MVAIIATDLLVAIATPYQNSHGFAISKGKGTMSTVCRQLVEDTCQLRECNFERKFAATTQFSWKVPQLPLFVFEHATHGMFVSAFGLQKSDWA